MNEPEWFRNFYQHVLFFLINPMQFFTRTNSYLEWMSEFKEKMDTIVYLNNILGVVLK